MNIHGGNVLRPEKRKHSEVTMRNLAATIGNPVSTPRRGWRHKGRAPLVLGHPETREYRARYKDNDLPVGDWSDVISVTGRRVGSP